ncbi:hypothetical protein [Bremerella sp. P1]|uniref:hypothetical protein n=1 Tax=Bremerella sp. P1 TaxID=3026424 RepID=UPI002368DBE5|nr:hypothetical protein [Bremerella sp. P1]WDI44208.1 hypothetical protein PSR63_09715 [Bremerella sp. P1]
MYDSDEYDEDWIDDEPEDDDQDNTMICPECGAEIFDDVDVCPVCLHAIIHDTSPWSGKSFTWILFGILGIIATIVALVMLFP